MSASTQRLFKRLRSTRQQKSNRLVNGLARGRPAALARSHDGLDRLLAGALDGAQSVADLLCSEMGSKAVRAAVDVGWLESQAHASARLQTTP